MWKFVFCSRIELLQLYGQTQLIELIEESLILILFNLIMPYIFFEWFSSRKFLFTTSLDISIFYAPNQCDL